ncbi:conjugal transfer protein TraF [Vibrio vulnificus]|nr:conjugal transfer protein TraF [Vibrio vulnificus]
MNKISLALAVLPQTLAAAGTATDSRSSGMGGTGVASASYLSAPFSNPALVASQDNDDFGIILATVGANVSDKQSIYNKLDSFQDISDSFLSGGIADPSDIERWRNALRDLEGGQVTGEVHFGSSMAIPNKYVSANLFTSANFKVLGVTHIDQDDLAITDPSTEAMKSTVQVVISGTSDIGITLAKDFSIAGKSVKVGISPKYQTLMSLTHQSSVASFDDDDYNFQDNHGMASKFNIDAGIAYSISESVVLGLSGKNLISHSLESNVSQGRVATLEVDPAYVTGLAYSNEWFTAALDVDLNAIKPLKEFDYEEQFTRVGIEIDAWGWSQIRAGYIHSMTDYQDDLVTAGIGLKPFGLFGLDVAAQYGKDDNYGVNAQLVMHF